MCSCTAFSHTKHTGGNCMNSKKITVIVGVLILMSVGLFGYFVGNPPCEVVDPDCSKNNESLSGPSIYSLIVDAAASFLQSNAEYQQYLSKVELSGQYNVTSLEMSLVLENAISQMSAAHSHYAVIYDLCLKTGLTQATVDKLSTFDYVGFQEINQLNPVIFEQAAAILQEARLADIYLELYQYTGKILEQLREIKAVSGSTQSLQLPLLWRTNQSYMTAAMFGQYSSEILMSLK